MELLGTAIAIAIISTVMDRLHSRDTRVDAGGQSDANYLICPPAILTKVYRAQTILGLAMFVFFYLLYMKNTPTVQLGHVIFSLVFAGIGIIVCVFAKKWALVVRGDRLVLKRLFKSTIEMKLSEIESYKIGKKDEIKLYRGGQKFVTIDALCDNYDRFLDSLKRAGVRCVE